MSLPSQELFSFGVISDIQYADHDDLMPMFASNMRYYRDSVEHTKKAVTDFNQHKAAFILQLGDMIDGRSKSDSKNALTCVLDAFKLFKGAVYHTIGNHELYNFSHKEIKERLFGVHGNPSLGYYSFKFQDSFRFICLNCYDVSLLGRTQTEDGYKRASEYLEVNPNDDLNSPTGMKGEGRRFLKFNGGIGDEQMSWLKNELIKADRENETVIIFGHISMLPEVTTSYTLLYNYEEVQDLLERSTSVKLVLSGHTHMYCSALSPSGKQYVSLPGVIETPLSGKAWSIVKVYPQRIHIQVYDNQSKYDIQVPLKGN